MGAVVAVEEVEVLVVADSVAGMVAVGAAVVVDLGDGVPLPEAVDEAVAEEAVEAETGVVGEAGAGAVEDRVV